MHHLSAKRHGDIRYFRSGIGRARVRRARRRVIENDLDIDRLANFKRSFRLDEDAALRNILLEFLSQRVWRFESNLYGIFDQ